ncbi:cytochrome c biogenesis protein [Thiosulfatimonas sediminis]|uniref:Cytochrome c biogenesis protein n=1 Tax=Thiosulfatimonas sediminis TaxID=2675054 RepID=A0A6F8PX65_9GAMM|nr:tetratricopeptide repeat protein [Thiosulfatimonas sediminis]BBP46686.1 cytochrome c biogenesis protein [Thiosulfatimonas sediminis]
MTSLAMWFSLILIIALAIILIPFLRQRAEPDSTTTQKQNKFALIGIALFVPVFSMAAYFTLGTPEFAEMQDAKPPQQITLVDKLEEKLAHNPKDLAGWLLLGRSSMITEDYDKAIMAFERALKLDPNNINALIPLADALAVKANGRLDGRSHDLLKQAFAIDPENRMTLWLLGMAEKQQGNDSRAAILWETLYQKLPDTDADKPIIARLLQTVGVQVATNTVNETPKTMKTTSDIHPEQIEIAIEIPDELKNSWSGATVFIYAKEPTGMPMPIAAQKISLVELPKRVTLGAKDEIMPNRKLSDFKQLTIGIRITDSNKMNQGDVLFLNEQTWQGQELINFIIKS